MAKKNNMLAEAIADAKTLREVALSNAKTALEEAFTPKLKSMISHRIQNEVEDDEEEIEDTDTDMTTTPDVAVTDPVTEEEEPDDDEEEIVDAPEDETDELDLEAILKELEDEDVDDTEDELDDVEDEIDDVEDAIEDAEETSDEEEMEDEFDDEEEELDLEAIIKELEGDELEDVEDELEDVEDAVEDAEDTEESEEDAEEFEIEDDVEEGLRYDDDELDELKAENGELKGALEVINTELKEIKLVNEKLLYINKVFKNNRLSESQKIKVVENFDRATNDREIKLIYATVMEAFEDVRKKLVKESITRKGLISGTKPKTKLIIEESKETDFAKRMKKLAGIK